MFSPDSPFLNIPQDIDPKQATFLDGMRHSVQIIDLSYKRLCQALTDLTICEKPELKKTNFTHIFLDVWAFVDAVERFRCLWAMQPNVDKFPVNLSKDNTNEHLKKINKIRNVSDHVAQRVDHIRSQNTSVAGELRWVTKISHVPMCNKSCFIRPGILRDSVSMKLLTDVNDISFINDSGSVYIKAGEHEANISLAYQYLCSFIEIAEKHFSLSFAKRVAKNCMPADMFGSAVLLTSGGLKPGTFVCYFEKKN